jgi:hypothetical protein
MINQFIVYIDNILIYSHSLAEHVQPVQQVFQRLQDHHLYVKAEKSAFHFTMVTFLGLVLIPGGVNMDESKVTAVLKTFYGLDPANGSSSPIPCPYRQPQFGVLRKC